MLLYRHHVDMSTDLRWPAPPDEVVGARLDEAFLTAVARRTGALDHEVRVDGLRSTVRRVMPTDRFPDFARRLAGDRLTLVETTTWAPDPTATGGRTGVVELEVDGAPLRARFTTALEPSAGDGTVEQVRGEVVARVPIVGGRIEKAVVPALEAAMAAQVDTFEERRGRG